MKSFDQLNNQIDSTLTSAGFRYHLSINHSAPFGSDGKTYRLSISAWSDEPRIDITHEEDAGLSFNETSLVKTLYTAISNLTHKARHKAVQTDSRKQHAALTTLIAALENIRRFND